jgi:hypothetical protein
MQHGFQLAQATLGVGCRRRLGLQPRLERTLGGCVLLPRGCQRCLGFRQLSCQQQVALVGLLCTCLPCACCLLLELLQGWVGARTSQLAGLRKQRRDERLAPKRHPRWLPCTLAAHRHPQRRRLGLSLRLASTSLRLCQLRCCCCRCRCCLLRVLLGALR